MYVCFVVLGVLIVTPLHLAITPTSVLRDPELGPYFMQLMENNEHDDRLLMILFLVIERARGQCSSWAPYPFYDAMCNSTESGEMTNVN